jgi:hypothetical protein
MVLGLSDPSLFCTDPAPDPDPSINKQKSKKNQISTFLLLFDVFSMKPDVNYLQTVKSKTKLRFFCHLVMVTDEKAGSDP